MQSVGLFAFGEGDSVLEEALPAFGCARAGVGGGLFGLVGLFFLEKPCDHGGHLPKIDSRGKVGVCQVINLNAESLNQ